MKIHRISSTASKTFIYLIMIFFVFFFLFPIFWLAVTSVKPAAEVMRPNFPTFDSMHFESYRELLNQYTFDQYYINSIIASGGATLFVALVAVPAAYGFTKYPYRGSGKVFMSCVLMRMIPFITLMVPLYMYMSWFGLLNTRTSLIIANTTFNLPFSLWIMEGYFRKFPNELIESASIDGSGRFGTLLKIVVPISLPSISTVIILTFLNTWKEFMFASVTAQSVSSRTITVGIAMLTQQYGIRWDLMSAAGTICIIPVLVVTIFFQKKIMRGMTMGALKG